MRKYNKILVVSFSSLLLIAAIGFVIFPSFLKFVIKNQISLRKNSLMRKFYLKMPFPLDFQVYFFNISNPLEVQEGAVPILQEIGPYHYKAYKEKIEVQDSEGEDSLTYTPYETYFFNYEKSSPLKPEDKITILHPIIVGMANIVSKDFPVLLPLLNKAIKPLFNDPQSIYLTTRVRDILFDGVVINCTIEESSTKAICAKIKTATPGSITTVSPNLYKFSILGPKNGTLPNRFKVLRGKKKSLETGRLVEIDHKKEINIWPEKKCNRYRGTDSWILPPFIDKNHGLWAYSVDLCRSIQLKYVEDTKFHSVAVEKYYADLGDMSSNPTDKCYCPTPKSCLPKGVMNLDKCIGIPIYVSLPHFLRADKKFLKKVRGLKPNTEAHIIKGLMLPMFGLPLSAQKRLQCNLPVKPIKKISLMRNLPEALHPILWVEEGIEVEGGFLLILQIVFWFLKIFNAVVYISLAISIVGMSYGLYLHHKDNKSRLEVHPVENGDISKNNA